MVDTTQTTTEKKLTQSDIRGVFLRSNLFQGSWNFERMQALGFCFSMVPAIRRLYPENNEARKQAIRRHLEFFNTQPFVAAPILGVTLALEEQRANGAEIDDGAINGIKVGLMGPLAGVGDPIFWGTVRPVFAALGAGIAMSGSLLGPLLFFILFNLVRLATRYYGVAYGYSKGIDIVKDMGGGFLQKLTEGASILGLFVMGALVNKWTHVNIPLVVSRITDQTGKEHVTTVQTILDQLMPGLVPLLLTFACMWLLRKKVNPLWIIVGFFVIGIAGYACGLLGLQDCCTLPGPFGPVFLSGGLMTITDLVLILFIAALLAFAIYDQFIMPRRNGPTLLAIPLLRRGRIDSVIFVGLIVILIYNNVTNHGALITTWLLSALALMGFYIFWIRVPKIIFKQKGFFFANVWIEYSRIKAMNLSEDGVLVMQLEQRRLLIRVRNIDDLEKIYKLLVSTQ